MSDLSERLRAENEKLRGEYETKAAELASIQIAFNDWKVMHSTVRLEVENERLRRSQSRRVGYVCEQCGWTLSAEPPKREPLSDDDINKLAWKQNLWTDHMIEFSFLAFAREVERAHGIGGSDE